MASKVVRIMKPLQSSLREANERRRHPRKGSRLLVYYELAGGQDMGYVIDVSLGGLCLETRQPCAVGETIALTFKLCGQREEPLQIWGKTTSAVPKGSRRWWVGVELDGLGPAAQEELASYLHS